MSSVVSTAQPSRFTQAATAHLYDSLHLILRAENGLKMALRNISVLNGEDDRFLTNRLHNPDADESLTRDHTACEELLKVLHGVNAQFLEIKRQRVRQLDELERHLETQADKIDNTKTAAPTPTSKKIMDGPALPPSSFRFNKDMMRQAAKDISQSGKLNK